MSERSGRYYLVYKKGNNVLNLPVSLATSVSSVGSSDSLVCEKCNTANLKQRYECNSCGKLYGSIGMIKQRFNKEHQLVYNVDTKKDFLDVSIDRVIEVVQEVPLTDVVQTNIEQLNSFGPLEVFNNDNESFKATIVQLWRFLQDASIALYVKAGYRGDQWFGYIVATDSGKIVLSKLTDSNRVKNPYQVDGDAIITPTVSLGGNTISLRNRLEAEFFERLKKGEELPKPKVKEEAKPVIPEGFFIIEKKKKVEAR